MILEEKKWCGREDLNLHGIATASPSSGCVCQFRHSRLERRKDEQIVTEAAYLRAGALLGSERSDQCFVGAGCAGFAGAAGAVFAGAGAAGFAGDGVVFGGAGAVVSSKIEPISPASAPARFTDSAMEVIMKTIAHHVVARERNVAAPRGPKAVWLPAPPKAPAKSAAVPLCSITTITSMKQTRMCRVTSMGVQRQPSETSPSPTSIDTAHFAQRGISVPCPFFNLAPRLARAL